MGLRAAGLLPLQEPSPGPAPSVSPWNSVYLHPGNLSWQGRGCRQLQQWKCVGQHGRGGRVYMKAVQGRGAAQALSAPLFLPAWVQIDCRASFLTSPSPLELVSPANRQRTLQTSPHLHFNVFTTSSHAALLTVPHIPLSLSLLPHCLYFFFCAHNISTLQ